MIQNNDDAVLALSVYNAVSLTGRDMTIDQVVGFLSAHWDPNMSRNAARVSAKTVAAFASELQSEGWVRLDGQTIKIPNRNPKTGRGEPLSVNYETGRIGRMLIPWR